jgi:hypothetical protein
MGYYGYCVLPREHGPPGQLIGILGGQIHSRLVDDFSVWVSEISRPDPVVENVQIHNQVVEAAVSQAVTPVPLRFGQWSESPDVFDSTIRDKADWYRERLAKFAGALEFGLRVAKPGGPESARVVHPAPGITGLEYMKALRDNVAAAQGRHEDEERIRARLSEVIADVVREERIEPARTPHGVVTIAHLVAREQFEEYRRRVHTLREQLPDLRFLLSGPWAPYSFANE